MLTCSTVKGLLFIILPSSRVKKLHFKHQMLILNVGKLKVNMSPPEDVHTHTRSFLKARNVFFAFSEVIFLLVDKSHVN